jgi:5-(carboxyamino)imidazole ribonucleotide synthase
MRNITLGIIGGGQLGMILIQKAVEFPVTVNLYDPNPDCSAAHFCTKFFEGSFDDADKLYEFGKQCDVVIYELEKVSVDALLKLQSEGVRIVSKPETLEWIQDKGVQNDKLKQAGFPVPDYELVEAAKVMEYDGEFPVVQKWLKDGYDGQGVNIARSKDELQEVDCVLEEMIDIEMELSVIVARNEQGEIVSYDPVEMVFDDEANLVDYLIAPARISYELRVEALDICKKAAELFGFVGVYAFELFLSKDGRLLVNEISPRVHNSGHQTVAANKSSQYEQQIRIALGLPLGSTDQISNCVMLNLLGAVGSAGETNYEGLEEAYSIDGVQYTFYGKNNVRPYRKMGHAVILEEDIDEALAKVQKIKQTLTINGNEK